MKILTFQEFTALPDGVIYSYFSSPERYGCEGLFRRGQVYRNDAGQARDFDEIALIAEPTPEDEGPDHPVFEVAESVCRWGMYEFDQRFAVYEAPELRRIAGLLWGYVLRDEMAAALAGVQRWIPVSERLPEVGGQVLFRAERSTWAGSSDGVGWFWLGEGESRSFPVRDVTHWMPLPAPPEGE